MYKIQKRFLLKVLASQNWIPIDYTQKNCLKNIH